MTAPTQSVSLVANGGTPVQLVNQKGAPYPTTGHGALVFNIGPEIIDAVLRNPTIIGGGGGGGTVSVGVAAGASGEVFSTAPIVCTRAWMLRDIIQTPGKNTMSVRFQNLPIPPPTSLVVRVDCGWNGATYGAHPADNRDEESLGPGIPNTGGMPQPPWTVGPGFNSFWFELMESEWVPGSKFYEGHCYEPGTIFDGSEPINEMLEWCRNNGPSKVMLPPGMIYIQKDTIRVPEGCNFNGAGMRVTGLFRASNVDQPSGRRLSHVIETGAGLDSSFRDVGGTEINDLCVYGNRGHMVYQRGGPAVAVGGVAGGVFTDGEIDIIPSSFAMRRVGIFGSGAYGYQISGDGFKRAITFEDILLVGADSDGVDFKNRQQLNQLIFFNRCRHFHWSLGSQGTHLQPTTTVIAQSIFTEDGETRFGVARTSLNTSLLNATPSLGEICTFIDGGMVGGISLDNAHYLAVDYKLMGPNDVNCMMFEAIEVVPTPVTISVSAPAFVTWVATPIINDQVVMFDTNGALPSPLEVGVAYYVVGKVTDGFNVSASMAGPPITTTGGQSGNHVAHGGWEATSTVDYGGIEFTAYMPFWVDGDVAFDFRGAAIRADACYAEARLLGHGGFRVRTDTTRFPGAIPPINNVLSGCMVKDVSDQFIVPVTGPFSGSGFSMSGSDVQLINPIFEGTGISTAFSMSSASRNLQIMSPKVSDCNYAFVLAGKGVNVTGGVVTGCNRQVVEVHGAAANVFKDLPPDAFSAIALGSANVRVNDPNHGLFTGSRLEFQLTNSTTNGLEIERSNLAGNYTITVVDADHYDVLARRKASAICQISLNSPGVVTWADMPVDVVDDDPVVLNNSNYLLPTPLVNETIYFVRNKSGMSFNLATAPSPGGTLINTSGIQGGVHTIIKVPAGGLSTLAAFDLDVFGGNEVGVLPGLGGSPTAVYPPDTHNVAEDIHFNGLRTYNDDPDNTCVVFALGENTLGVDRGQANDISIQNCHDRGSAVAEHSYATNIYWGPGNTGGIPNIPRIGPTPDAPCWEMVEEIVVDPDAPPSFLDVQNLFSPNIRVEMLDQTRSSVNNTYIAVSSDQCVHVRLLSGDSQKGGDAVGTGAIVIIGSTAAEVPVMGQCEITNFNKRDRSYFWIDGGPVSAGAAIGGLAYQQGPRASIVILSGTVSPGVNQITNITVNGVPIIAAPVDMQATPDLTADALAVAINALTSTTGFIGDDSGETIIIRESPNVIESNYGFSNNYPVIMTVSGDVRVNVNETTMDSTIFNSMRIDTESGGFLTGTFRIYQRGG